MAVGLGENSPIKLQLSRESFNAAIGRHPQPIRWLVATSCPCIQKNQKVDANCPLCHGKRVYYTTPTKSERVETIPAAIDGVIAQDNVIWVRDFTGEEYTITAHECVTYVDGVKKGQQYQVKFVEDVTQTGSGIAQYVSDKLYRISLPTQVVFGEVQGDLLKVTASFNGNPLTVTNLFRNCFEISDTINPEDQVDVVYEYINPFEFLLLSQNLQKADQKYLSDVNGNAMLTFPQRWEIYESDIIISLNASQLKKHIYESTGDIDNLPSYYLGELKQAYSIRNGVRHIYIPYVDFVLYKGNKIKWIQNKPEEGEQVSITYSYYIVYKVMSDMPAPRTSENNRFPRKVALSLYTDFNSREGF